MKKKVLIVGGTGQLGFFLCKNLNNKKIFVTTRNIKKRKNLKFKKDLKKNVSFIQLNVLDKSNIFKTLKTVDPSIIFYLAGQSVVSKSYKQKRLTLDSNYLGCLNFLEILKRNNFSTKFINFSSAEIFKQTKKKINIDSSKFPVSPYGFAKYKSFKLIQLYRKKYKLKTYNAVLFNAESTRRPDYFLIPKICDAAIKTYNSKGKINKKFSFGNINIVRDWGWANEYMRAIVKYIKLSPRDFIIATGKSYSIKELINYAFGYFGFDFKKYIIVNKKLFRRNEVLYKYSDISKLKKEIKYVPTTTGLSIIKKIILSKLS
jgi:GDPmannose 4,6-dehydratase